MMKTFKINGIDVSYYGSPVTGIVAAADNGSAYMSSKVIVLTCDDVKTFKEMRDAGNVMVITYSTSGIVFTLKKIDREIYELYMMGFRLKESKIELDGYLSSLEEKINSLEEKVKSAAEIAANIRITIEDL